MTAASRLVWMRRMALAAVATTLVLMALGAWVKANGAGLSCPDWPQCYGEWLPPFPSADNGGTWQGETVAFTQAEILYEWAHRFVVSLLLVPLAWLAALATLAKGVHRTARALSISGLLLYVAQAGLGGVTVVTGNPPWATTAHLVLATVLLTVLVVAATWLHLKPLADARLAPAADAPTAQRVVSYVYPDSSPTAPTEREA